MRRLVLFFSLLSVVALGAAPGSQASFYVGHGEGIRVAFRVKGDELVWANVFVRLYCTRRNGERHLNRYAQNYATPDYPLHIDRDGAFKEESPDGVQEEGFSEEEALVGRVGAKTVTGKFEYSFSFSLPHRKVDCQTGSYPFGHRTAVPFRARLKPQR
jgi:hypothetical protein